jgi:ribosomal protein S9
MAGSEWVDETVTRLLMESTDALLVLLLSVTIVILVVACVVIFSRRRQARSAADEAQRKVIEEQRREVEQEAGRRAEEEERNRVDEEAQQKAEAQRQIEELQQADEEERHSEADEAQRKEEQQQVADEQDRRAGEEKKRSEEEKGHKAEEVQPELEKERKRLEPVKRGGRPRGFSQEHETQPAQDTTSRCPKPEIICWKKERQWMAAVEIPEEFLEKSGLAVLQDGSLLRREESREACWPLERVLGEVVVQWNEGEAVRETRIVPGQDGYLLFKLSSRNQNRGRRVKSPSAGSYLVMVPDNWQRDDTLSGPPLVTPEPVSLIGYKAHFFELEKAGNGKIAFRIPTGESFVIQSKAPQFALVGNRLNDASEDKGPLFGKAPPRIRALDEQGWKDVATIVVGEEGMGKEKWRTHFTPNSDGQEQDLPPAVVDRKSGWYFLRFYDTNDDLIESLDFRFICALKEIKIPQPPPFPSAGGHEPVCVEFLHEPGCAVQPADGLANIQIKQQDDKTTLTIPPDPTYDETRWLVRPQGKCQVEVTILVERLWWGIGEVRNAPAAWEDQPFAVARDHFAATSKKALWLRLPTRRWVDKVLVGFDQPKARPYDVKVAEKTIAVPFCEFCDSRELGDRTQEHSLRVWIERDGRFMEGVVAVIPASRSAVAPVAEKSVSPPRPRWVGFGRKKTAVAEAGLQYGFGDIRVNGLPLDAYFKETPARAKHFLQRLLELDRVHETLSRMEVLITVTGSDPTTTRQAKAAAHALARALMSYDPKLMPSLKQAGFGGVRVKKRPGCNGGSR